MSGMNERWLRWCLTGIMILLGVIAVELSVLMGGWEQAAYAQQPKEPAFVHKTQQRLDLLDEQRETTKTLQRILEQLRSGTIKVQLVSTDNENTAQPADKTRGTRNKEPEKKRP